jgi:tetratricopeptide (TPR) repeat protein
MWKRLAIIFGTFILLGLVILAFFDYAENNFTDKMYAEYLVVTQEQINKLKKALDDGDDQPITYYYLSLSYWHIDKEGPAMEYIQQGIDKHPDETNLHLMKAKYFIGLGEIEKAREILEAFEKAGHETEAAELRQTIETPALVPPRGKKNILR